MKPISEGERRFKHQFYTLFIIIVGIVLGVVITILASQFAAGSTGYNLLTSMGSGLMATAFISLILELIWSNQRTEAEKSELQPIYDKLKDVPDKLGKLEGRLEAFKQLGFNNCYSSRNDALKTFLGYAQNIVKEVEVCDQANTSERSLQTTVNIVSSSARGLMGYIDREPSQLQKAWRELITMQPKNFRLLLTHPAFAHLRQPAEERASGDIELEILKTTIYLHCVAGMKSNELRFYRGSPTVFAIQVGDHILVNPYPYGTMAMDTLCLEFERGKEGSYIAKFMNMHFNHTWAFMDQPSKTVDYKPLIAGIDKFDDILQAFSECTFLNSPKRLRLTTSQVEELDIFTGVTLKKVGADFIIAPPDQNPFMKHLQENNFFCSDQDPPVNMEAVPRDRNVVSVN
jgi:hypothetical protein